MELMEPVDELKSEVSTDVHGTAEGPRLGRQRVINRVRVFAIAMYSI
jgi:BRCA1-associated RING domain protein 1